MYDLIYIVGGKLVETVERNKPLRIIRWKKKQLASSSQYKFGLLVAKKTV